MSNRKWIETRNLLIERSRTTLQLEPEAWALIDSCAAKLSMTWADWVRSRLANSAYNVSRATIVRAAAMREFYQNAMVAAAPGIDVSMIDGAIAQLCSVRDALEGK